MALRYSERRRTLESLTKRTYPTTIHRAELTFASGGSEILTFRPGLTVIAGGNGAGKSTVLAALWRCLAPEGLNPRNAVAPWLRGLSMTGVAGGSDWEAGIDFASGQRSGSRPFECTYVNAAYETEMILHQLSGDANVADLLEGLDPLSLENEIPESLAYSLRRDYTKLNVYEVDSFVETEYDLPIPYFIVESMGVTYDLPQMGRGELSALYLLWRLDRLTPGSIVLIEEPESHLAFLSQQLLFEVLARKIVELDLWVIASSHSPDFFSALPDRSVTLVASLPTPRIESDLSCAEVSSYLGLTPRIGCIAFVEDYVAACLFKAILELEPNLEMTVATKILKSGESGVRDTIKQLEHVDGSGPSVVGILDGDQRDKLGSDLHCLPGSNSPEQVIREQVGAWRAGERPSWDYRGLRDEAALRRILDQIDGKEDHDWFSELGKHLGGTQEAARLGLSLLLQDEAARKQVATLLDWLAEKST